MGVNFKDVWVEVEKIIGCGFGFVVVEIFFIFCVKCVFELFLEEVCQFGYNYIGIEYLLFGLICEGEGVVVCVLENFGVDLVKVCI